MADQFKNDVFISYSHEDERWITETLLPRLEAAQLRVSIDFRDFTAGTYALVNMQNAVKDSRHVLLVLTPAWVNSQWTTFESLLSLTSDPAALQRRTIPLMLETSIIPELIRGLTYIDFTRLDRLTLGWERLLHDLGASSEAVAKIAAADRAVERMFQDKTRFEAAMPKTVQLGQVTEIKVMLSFPGSQGLRGHLPARTKFGDWITKKDVEGAQVNLWFPLDPISRQPLPITMLVRVSSRSFELDQPVSTIEVVASYDSGPFSFHLTPRAAQAQALVLVELLRNEQQPVLVGSLTLKTEIVAQALAAGQQEWLFELIPLESRNSGDGLGGPKERGQGDGPRGDGPHGDRPRRFLVVGLFDAMQDAQSVVQELRGAGFDAADISFTGRNTDAAMMQSNEYIGEGHSEAVEGASFGAAGGPVVGGLGGLLVGLGALMLPGIGPVVAAGSLATALGSAALGAGTGAATGGLLGALVGAGIPEEDAHIYAEAVRRGGALVMIGVEESISDTALDIMERHNVVDVEERGTTYRQSGWERYDESAGPYTATSGSYSGTGDSQRLAGASDYDRGSKIGTADGSVAGATTGAVIGGVAGALASAAGAAAGVEATDADRSRTSYDTTPTASYTSSSAVGTTYGSATDYSPTRHSQTYDASDTTVNRSIGEGTIENTASRIENATERGLGADLDRDGDAGQREPRANY